MRPVLAVILTVVAVIAIATGAGLIFADRISTQVGLGAGLAVAGLAVWLIVRDST